MYQFKSKVRYSEVNSDKVLTLAALTDYLQDTCTFQSEGLGAGMDFLRARKEAWILSSWEIVIKDMPKVCDEISVGTFPCSFKGFYGHRNFVVTDASDKVVAFANSLWVYINYETKKPARIPEEVARAYDEVIGEPIDFDWSDRKIKIEGEGVEGEPVAVHSFFIDTNEHMNNGKYIMVAEEYLPEGFKVERVRAEYRNAAVLGDILYPVVYTQENSITVVLNDEEKKPYAVIQFVKDNK
ncbi:MAG: acyl-[Roseburia sp.]|nr:acyl-[acyl-carrier-protein] thioesterase [Roseburia sp.]